MLLTILLLAEVTVTLNAPPAPTFVPGTFAPCVSTRPRQANGKAVARIPPPTARAAPLGELPSGGLHLTVVRTIGGCQVPTLIKDGYGFVPANPRDDKLKKH